jgi:hypothetical protein
MLPQVEKVAGMFDWTPIWDFPDWLDALALFIGASFFGFRFDRGTTAFLERLDEMEKPVEFKIYMTQIENFKCLRNIQAFATVIAVLVGYKVLFAG